LRHFVLKAEVCQGRLGTNLRGKLDEQTFLQAEVSPRLTVDLHEHEGDDFWMSARHQVHSYRPGAARKDVFSADRHISVDAEDEEWCAAFLFGCLWLS
jgi:hypothetical protein